MSNGPGKVPVRSLRMRIHADSCRFAAGRLLPAQSFVAPVFPTPSYFRDHFARPPARVELQPPCVSRISLSTARWSSPCGTIWSW
jgi:hypothetical protein